jgi:hypothetical protein
MVNRLVSGRRRSPRRAPKPQSQQTCHVTCRDLYSGSRTQMHRKPPFFLGLVLYVVSFFLFVTGNEPRGSVQMRGYVCAGATLFMILEEPQLTNLPRRVRLWVFVSGLINPVFLFAVLVPWDHQGRSFAIARIVTTLMLGATVAVFVMGHDSPREGYFLWLVGILLTLYSRPTEPHLSPSPAA